MLTALLLAAEPATSFHWPTVGTILLWLVAGAAGLERLYGWVFGGTSSRLAKVEAAIGQFVDKDALEKRFGEGEGKQKLMAADLLNQHNTLHEYERERERLTGEFRGAITQLQKDGRALEPLPSQVADLKAKFEALTGQINDLKSDMRANKLELKEDMKNNKGDILAAIRDLKTHA